MLGANEGGILSARTRRVEVSDRVRNNAVAHFPAEKCAPYKIRTRIFGSEDQRSIQLN